MPPYVRRQREPIEPRRQNAIARQEIDLDRRWQFAEHTIRQVQRSDFCGPNAEASCAVAIALER
jgi:hypothetical protein